ncbi:MAG: GNAT family N-acetyltransferase [Candidatus Azotimanducaceae bacterium]
MSYKLSVVGSIDDIGVEHWNLCSNPESLPYDPFLSFNFLHALEKSNSVVASTGWVPHHLKLEDVECSRTLAVVPMYLKNHSAGEYVFDQAWADAFQRAGGRYYPKLQIAIPFTPATGRRLLIRNDQNHKEIERYLVGGLAQIADQAGVSSVHITFAEKLQWERTGDFGFLRRTHKQYHWQNRGYDDFEGFLNDLSSKKRKNIRRERRDALSNNITIELLSGEDIREHHWDAFYSFYIDTSSRKWGYPYLTREFFSLIGDSMAKDILLVMCRRDDRYIAGAINFIGGESLFGRNWGCIEEHPFLHFEVCYYQAIEYAIRYGLKTVEAGAQGDHKLSRGYMPTKTYSAHWIVNPSFRKAVEDFLEAERQWVQEEIHYVEDHSPFRKA